MPLTNTNESIAKVYRVSDKCTEGQVTSTLSPRRWSVVIKRIGWPWGKAHNYQPGDVLLKTMFNRAIESGKASSNSMVKVNFFKENNARCRMLEPDERERL